MPNPFVSGSGGIQQDTSTDTQLPIKPTLEYVAGHNNPYRGLEQHGVAANNDPFPDEDWNDRHTLTVEPEPEDPEPIPVRIVNQGAEEVRRFRIARTYSTDNPARLINASNNRTVMRVRNLDTARTAYFSHEPIPTFGTAFGYPIPPGTEASFTAAQQEVWIVSDQVSTSIALAVYWEYSVTVE